MERSRISRQPGSCSTSLVCKTCGQRFDYFSQLRQHESSHRRSFTCLKCPQTFSEYSDLQTHIKSNHSPKPQRSNSVSTKKPIKSKNSASHKQKTGKTSQSGWSNALLTKTKPHPCMFCEKTFSDPNALERHILHHTKEKPFPCTELNCPYRASQQQAIVTHVGAVHKKENRYACPQCSASFAYTSFFKKHMDLHPEYTDTTPVVPPVPGAITITPVAESGNGSSMAMATPVRNLEISEAVAAPSRDGDSKTGSVTSIEMSGAGTILDPTIGIRSSGTERCLAVKRLEKPSKTVNITTSRIGKSAKAARRVFVTSAENPDPGTVILVATGALHYTTTFQFPSSMPVSINVGNSEPKMENRPQSVHSKYIYTCNFCENKYSSKQGLELHIMKHTGEKPFFCPVSDCPFRSAAKSRIKIHVDRNHNEHKSRHACGKCSASFQRISALSRHMKAHGENELLMASESGEEHTAGAVYNLSDMEDESFTSSDEVGDEDEEVAVPEWAPDPEMPVLKAYYENSY